MRVRINGKGTFDILLEKISLLRSCLGSLQSKRLNVRATVTKRDLDIVGIADSIESLGFGDCTLTLVTSADDSEEYALTKKDIPVILNAYNDLAERFYERLVTGKKEPLSWFKKYFDRVVYLHAKEVTCGAGLGYIGVSVDGSFFICHRFFGIPSGKMGDLTAGIDRSFTDTLLKNPIGLKEACKQCWASKFCGGGCYFEGYIKGGDYFMPNDLLCDVTRHSIMLSLKIYSRLLREQPAILQQYTKSKNYMASNNPDATLNNEVDQEVNTSTMETDFLYDNYSHPCRNAGVIEQEIDNEIILYNSEDHKVYAINQSARKIWECCDGDKTIGEISQKLSDEFGIPVVDILSDVQKALINFSTHNLLMRQGEKKPL